jgi:uncharacterized protein
MRFEWDEEKNRRNIKKHGVSFETAALVFEDPYGLTQRDLLSEDEERWITLGVVELAATLFVVHTLPDRECGLDTEATIRIISARRATPRERKQYEEAHQATTRKHRRPTRRARRRH